MLKIIAAKPWPEHKASHGKEVLNNEWIAIQNTGKKPISLKGIHLCRLAHTDSGKVERKLIHEFICEESLQPGKVVHLCSGRKSKTPEWMTKDENDVDGHLYTGKQNFIFKKTQQETLSLLDYNAVKLLDEVTIDVTQNEGAIYVRKGGCLIKEV